LLFVVLALLIGPTLFSFILSLLFLPPTLLFLALAFSLALRLSLSPLLFALAAPLILIIVVPRWTWRLFFVLLLTPFNLALSAVGTILPTGQVAAAEGRYRAYRKA